MLPKCSFHITSSTKCGETVVPLSKFCLKHILEDPGQVLFRACGHLAVTGQAGDHDNGKLATIRVQGSGSGSNCAFLQIGTQISKYVLNILLLLITYFQLTPQDLWTTGLARLPLPTCWKELPAFITLSSKHLSQPRTNLKGGLHYLKLKSRKKYAAQKYFPNLKFRSKFCSRLEITL